MIRLLDRVRQMGVASHQNGVNLIAFSGGVDSSLVAAAVHRVFSENTICVIGKSASLPAAQLSLARKIAMGIGAPLREIETKEGTHDLYLSNQGMSCYSCKQHLYSALLDVNSYVKQSNLDPKNVRIFNGTNKDDTKDVTRVGLVAAQEFQVLSPIDYLTKDEVRFLAKEFGLPNYSFAASPCLRSRLAMGVRATSDNLRRIESAEILVRSVTNPQEHNNIRVRHLKSGAARIELDESLLNTNKNSLETLAPLLADLGFHSVEFGVFRSGSVAAAVSPAKSLDS